MNIQTKARLDAQFWAHQRQNISLLYRGKARQSTIDAVKSELADILDSTIITYPPTLLKLGIDWYSTFEQRKEALNVSNAAQAYTENEHKFMQIMAEKAEDGRKANWCWRIAQEAQEKQSLGWYPFFITLTVNPNWTDPETLWKEGREFRKFIRRCSKVVTGCLGHPPAHKKTKEYDYRAESDYVTYAAVIEHGASREHHHCHILMWLREIPDQWKQCPNRFVISSNKRTFNECCQMRRMWKWSLPGLSKFNYYRTLGDVWKEHGFCTPIDVKTSAPMRIAPAVTAGRYITKYLQKEHKEWHHRMKCTRNLGMKKLKKLVQKQNPKIVEALTWRAKNYSQLHSQSLIHSVPPALIRSVARQQHYLNRYMAKQLDLATQLKTSSNSFTSMLKSVRLGARPDRMLSQDFYDWVCQHLPEEKEFCDMRFIEAHRIIGKTYPKTSYRVEKSTTIGANYIGLALSV